MLASAIIRGIARGRVNQMGMRRPLVLYARSMASYGYPSYRKKRALPVNTVIKFVPQQEAWVIERFGKFNRILSPGLAILIPIIDEIKYVQSLKEMAIEIPSQSAITLDNVTLHLDGVLYLRVVDPYKASYGVEDPEFAVTQLAQTTMRSELGKISLDNVFQERDTLNHNIVAAINHAAEVWGIRCLRYEIRDIQLPKTVVEAMQMQVEAERKKRSVVLQSEGAREAAINVAEGQKQSKILASEAVRREQINHATGEAEAIIAKAQARATGILSVAEALSKQSGDKAAGLNVAELYVEAFSKLAKTNNTVILPASVGDPASMVAQALAVYGQVTNRPAPPDNTPSGSPSESPDNPLESPDKAKAMKAQESAKQAISNLVDDIEQQRKNVPHFTAFSSPTRTRDFQETNF
ncbi:stomatin-like protein 2, mitochondrial [Nematostella vectensis]|uniref:stomatin-like protein 2, mitochondrial n=1 Tax=Nematostella vectensis TaxID=45351 RepID=UPI0020779175|nr:stomatin-like protein 2, mitochondrial [Nematostella vectensis]